MHASTAATKQLYLIIKGFKLKKCMVIKVKTFFFTALVFLYTYWKKIFYKKVDNFFTRIEVYLNKSLRTNDQNLYYSQASVPSPRMVLLGFYLKKKSRTWNFKNPFSRAFSILTSAASVNEFLLSSAFVTMFLATER